MEGGGRPLSNRANFRSDDYVECQREMATLQQSIPGLRALHQTAADLGQMTLLSGSVSG